MYTHPTIHFDIARGRQQDALAQAERFRLAHAARRSAKPRPRFVGRLAALARSALRRNTPVGRTVRDCPGRAEA
jgi:hypothetical protein